MNNKEYQNYILNTLQYKKVFTQPMTFHQIIHFGHGKFDDLNLLQEAFKELLKNKKIKFKNGVYYLNQTKIKNHDKRFTKSQELIEEIDFVKKYLSKIPFIKFVGVSGSLASYNFEESTDDIDLFIVCEEGRVWISRFFTVLIFKLLNVYVNDTNSNYKICPNFYISTKSMNWKQEKRNIYVAHEIAMLQPLINKENYYFKFLSANKWVKEFLPNFEFDDTYEDLEERGNTTVLDLIDSIFMDLQKKFMKNFSGFEILEKEKIHFLKVDHSIKILDSFQKKKIS
jgi:hypothetical protein